MLGGRLSSEKINIHTGISSVWTDKLDWINDCNSNWDKVDKIFLEEIPNSYFIDMRSTQWKSDIDSPLIGGASPSHYQSEYYREIFYNLRKYFFEG